MAIMPNDTETYREDSFDNMKAFAAEHAFTFPYVIDETQEVAEPMTLSARRISSASTSKTSCSIVDGSMPRAYSRGPMPAAICSRQ